MKKISNRKLALQRQTIRLLVPSVLRRAAGGTQGYTGGPEFWGDNDGYNDTYQGEPPPDPDDSYSGNTAAAISRNIC